MTLSYGDVKITKIRVKESIGKGRQLAWTNGAFQQRHRNYKKESNVKTRTNNKAWRREESDFQSCQIILKVLFFNKSRHAKIQESMTYTIGKKAINGNCHWESPDIGLNKDINQLFKICSRTKGNSVKGP